MNPSQGLGTETHFTTEGCLDSVVLSSLKCLDIRVSHQAHVVRL